MPTLDLVTRFIGVDAGGAKGYATLGDSARLASAGVKDYTAAEKQAAAVTKIAADAAVRASDLRLQASAALREAQRLEAAGDTDAAAAAKAQADSLLLQARAASASARELKLSASAAREQAASFDASEASTLTSGSSLKQLLGHASGLTSVMEDMPAPIAIMAGALGKLTVVAGVAGLAIAGISLDLATKYQSALTRLHTGAGESLGGLATVEKQLLGQSRQLGVGATQLAAAMYPIESAGFHGAAGVKILHDSVQGALADGADFTTVADAVTSALNSYSLGAGSAAGITDEMVKAVADGKTTMQDLASSIGTVAPEAAALGVPFAQVLGAISTMTSQGTGASKAAQSLRYALKSIADPTDAATTALEGIGLKASSLGDELTKHGLVAAFTMLEDSVASKFPRGSHAYLAALANIVGGTRGLQAVLTLTGKHLDDFNAHTKNVATGLNEAKSGIQGWSDYTKTFRFNIDDAKAGLEELAISFGTKLLPDATKVMHWLATSGVDDLQRFGNWFERNKGVIGAFGAYTVRTFGYMGEAVLDFASVEIDGMAAAFGWVPHFGGKLKAAAASFTSFRNTFTSDVTHLSDSMLNLGNKTGQSLADGLAAGLSGPAEADALRSAHDLGVHAAAAVAFGAKVQSPSKATIYVGKMLAEGLIDGWTGEASKIKDLLTTGVEDALTHLNTVLDRQLTTVEDRLKTSQSKLSSFLSARKSAITSMASGLTGAVDLSSLFGTDANGNPTVGNAGQYIAAQVGPLEAFAKDLKWGRKHLSEPLLQDIIGLGAVQGDQVLRQFMSGQSSASAADKAIAQIQRYATQAATVVVESPTEKRALVAAEFQVALSRVAVEEAKEQNRLLREMVAHGLARDVKITIDTGGKVVFTNQQVTAMVQGINKALHHGTIHLDV